jgi:hypothetical protein
MATDEEIGALGMENQMRMVRWIVVDGKRGLKTGVDEMVSGRNV